MPVTTRLHHVPLAISSCILIIGLYIICDVLSHVYAEEPASATAETYRYYKETGHNIGGLFLHFYDMHGGMDRFGLPITEVITDTETGRTIQYFERARFELYPDLPPESAVVLSNLGTMLTSERQEWVFQRQPRETILPDTLVLPLVGLRYFLETGHSLRGAFGTFWDTQGATYLFGYPISEPLVEKRGGRTILVQYFERTRLEYHFGTRDKPDTVQLGMLGREYLKRQQLPQDVLQPAPEIIKLAEATTPYDSEESPGGQNIILSASRINGRVVASGQTFSFLDAVGPITDVAGFVEGYGIANMRIVPMIGGGICQVSSALYEAAFGAGLEILERHNHSFVLSFFANHPGIEAAVYTDENTREDLRWRNDTPHAIYISATPDREQKVVRVVLWGISDGRTVTISEPETRRYSTVEDLWVPDAEMEAGTFQQYSAGSPGMDVVVGRHVVDAEGKVIRSDRIGTHYAAASAIFHYGPGGNPNETTTPTTTPTDTPTATPEEPSPLPTPDELPSAAEPSTPTAEPPAVEPPTAEPSPDVQPVIGLPGSEAPAPIPPTDAPPTDPPASELPTDPPPTDPPPTDPPASELPTDPPPTDPPPAQPSVEESPVPDPTVSVPSVGGAAAP